MNVTLFNSSGPNAEITVIDRNYCPESLLRVCNVPDDARKIVKNNTQASLIDDEGIFVRGVNSSFYQVEISGDRYYVHEQYVKR